MSDLTFDPENYELDSTEGFLYVNNGALKFKSSNNILLNNCQTDCSEAEF